MAIEAKSQSIAAVVVTFNRKVLLIECLKALLNQQQSLDHIYLIDNASTDGTPELLREEGFLDHPLIEYVRLFQNTGGAGGFHEGIKLAHEGGHDWIWVMDDDAEPKVGALFNLLAGMPLDGYLNYSGVCGKVMGLDGEPQYAHRGNFSPSNGQISLTRANVNVNQDISYASFVGLLINGLAIKSAGYPLEEFFIWFDDIEYCQRLNKFGPIYYNPDSEILHKDNVLNLSEKPKAVRVPSAIPFGMQWKFLCGFRNYIYLMMHHGNKGFSWALWMLFRKTVRILLVDPHKLKLIQAYFSYWKQAVGISPFRTIKPAEWNVLK